MRSAAVAIGIAISIVCGCGRDSMSERAARFELLEVPAGLDGTWAAALSGDGRVVVGRGSPWRFQGYDWHVALRWVGGRAESLGVPGAASLVSGDGAVVAGSRTLVLTFYRGSVVALASEPFTWSEASGAQPFFWRPPEPLLTSVSVLSPDGRVFLGAVYEVGGDAAAYRWTDGGVEVLPRPAIGHFPAPAAMTPDGAVIAGTVQVSVPRDDGGSEGQSRPVRWADGNVAPYPVVEGLEDCRPQALSHDGRVAVGECWEHGVGFSRGRAVRWESDRGETLAPLFRETYSGATDVSADGSVIAGALNRQGELGIFVWTLATGKRDLVELLVEGGAGDDIDGWALAGIAGLSDDGRVVAGTAQDSTGRLRAFRAVLPE